MQDQYLRPRPVSRIGPSSRLIGPDVSFRSLFGMTDRGASHTAVTRTPRSDSSAINCSSCAFFLSGSCRASFRYLRARQWSMATQLQRNRVWTGGAASGSAIGTPNAGSAGAGTTGVSGVPAGPGSAGGTNNSVNDPSGIGNAAKVPPPATSPRGSR